MKRIVLLSVEVLLFSWMIDNCDYILMDSRYRFHRDVLGG